MTAMTGKEKVLKVANNKKVFRAGDVDMPARNTHKYIARLVEEGLLERVGYGLYSLANNNFTETQSLLEVAVKVPSGVLCLVSALRFHDLTTQNPFEVWMAIERDGWIPKVETVPVRIFRFAPKVYQAGIEAHTIEGVEVKVYSAAKTVADCFYYQKTVGLDVAIEALRDAWRKRRATMDELYHFAQVRNIKNVMLPYLNTLS
jgi:predicted transcriptional regulator of viral defense system